MTPEIIEVTTLGDLLVRAARRSPAADAVVFPGRRRTYGDLLTRSRARARSLVALGVERGDRVGIYMPNCIEYPEVLFGCALVGAVAVPINSRYRDTELAYVTSDAQIRVLITKGSVADGVDFLARVRSALPSLAEATDPVALRIEGAPELEAVVVIGGEGPGTLPDSEFEALNENVAEGVIDELRSKVIVRDPVVMMYTSGTTAQPKGCPLSHEALVRNGIAMAQQRYLLTEEDRFWDPLPMFHMAAILPLTAVIATGGAFLSMEHIEPGAALAMMEGERATVAYPSFPTVTAELIAHPEFAERDLSRLRVVNNVAPPDTLRRFQAAFPQATQVSAYGLTEAGGVISFNELTDDADARATTCGRPFRGIEVRIVDPDNDEEIPQGERGEIQIRGYSLFEGYHRAPEKTAGAMAEGGWLRTGDLCSLDTSGRIRYHGRLKDMLKVGGENVAAVEIESFLGTHPAVKLVQVVGVPDERLAEVPVAFVELQAGADTTEQQLIDYCTGKIASFKIPRNVRFVDQWPMSATKIQKFRLREQFADELDG